MSELTLEDHLKVIRRDPVPPFDLYKAAQALAYLIVGHTQLPFEWSRERIEDGNGNEVFPEEILEALNQMPGLVLALAERVQGGADGGGG